MTGPASGVTGKRFEIESPVGPAYEFGSPGFELVNYINDVVDPYARQTAINQLSTMLENIFEMKLRAVIPAHGRSESATCHRRCAAGGTALGDLNNVNTSFGALERGHRAGRSPADDQHVSSMTLDGNLVAIEIGAPCHRFRTVFAISTNAFTQASAKRVSLMCRLNSSTGAIFSCFFRASMKS